MPIYDYRCDACGHVFSAVQSYSEGQIEKCPNCGERPRRLITAPAIVFKGGGWYKTDSRGAAPTEGESTPVKTASDSKTDAKPGSKSGSTSDAKSASKPESKTESKPSGEPPKSEPKS